eukprot:CAMPEP_0172489488 /NCGR_PEP_ID=MMETSP1066-20121228/19515_1 /TAXON_ID=671091 /ORGANISM="Coscinodiscus wailesii, Strain CCMP2513" /LENGTH=794 /DNA_ID=CAMNT_0013257399 /DNA_START=121 /DNA_END=2508 /DNA_ORIENTATION=+
MKLTTIIISSLLHNASPSSRPFVRAPFSPFLVLPRGGGNGDTTITTTTDATNDDGAAATAVSQDGDDSLHEKVQNAMRKLGLSPSSPPSTEETPTPAVRSDDSVECEDGVCPLPTTTTTAANSTAAVDEESSPPLISPEEPTEISPEDAEAYAAKLSKEYSLPISICRASLHASQYSMEKAREMLTYEVTTLQSIAEDSEAVQTLVTEGFDSYMARRALALCEGSVDDARAVLLAEAEDEKEEAEEEAAAAAAATETPLPAKTIAVGANFDPTAGTLPPPSPSPPPTPSSPAEVIYSVTTSSIQSVVLESPVPVLLDVYAPWCGPCQQLTPALENLARKSNGMFRLAKLNSDEEKPIAGPNCLGVTGLPTLFGIKDGEIINVKVGAPRSDEEFKSFMMEFMTGTPDKSVTEEEKLKLKEKSQKLANVAAMATLSFSQRESLVETTKRHLTTLVASLDDDEETALSRVKVLQKCVDNVLRHPRDAKYRRLKATNPVVAAQLLPHPSLLAVLKLGGWRRRDADESWGYHNDDDGAPAKVVNTAPLKIVSKTLRDWIVVTARRVADAKRRRQEDEERSALVWEESEYETESEEEEDLSHLSVIQLRDEGKKRVRELRLDPDEDTLSSLLEYLPPGREREEVTFVCAAKRLTVDYEKDAEACEERSLRDWGLYPSASVVLKFKTKRQHDSAAAAAVDSDNDTEDESSAARRRLTERMAKRKAAKKGSHTMQSVGIYAKDDNNKAELIDGGGGVWYEHDVTDSEEEENNDKGDNDDEAQEEETKTSDNEVEEEDEEEET